MAFSSCKRLLLIRKSSPGLILLSRGTSPVSVRLKIEKGPKLSANTNLAAQIGRDQDEYEKRAADTFGFRLAHLLEKKGMISSHELIALHAEYG